MKNDLEEITEVWKHTEVRKTTHINIAPDMIEAILRNCYGMTGDFSYDAWFCATVTFSEVDFSEVE